MRGARGEDLQVRGELGCPGVCLGLGCGLAGSRAGRLAASRPGGEGARKHWICKRGRGSGRARRDPAPKMGGPRCLLDSALCLSLRRFDAHRVFEQCIRACSTGPQRAGEPGRRPRSIRPITDLRRRGGVCSESQAVCLVMVRALCWCAGRSRGARRAGRDNSERSCGECAAQVRHSTWRMTEARFRVRNSTRSKESTRSEPWALLGPGFVTRGSQRTLDSWRRPGVRAAGQKSCRGAHPLLVYYLPA